MFATEKFRIILEQSKLSRVCFEKYLTVIIATKLLKLDVDEKYFLRKFGSWQTFFEVKRSE